MDAATIRLGNARLLKGALVPGLVAAASLAVAQAIAEVSPDQLEVRSLQDYYS